MSKLAIEDLANTSIYWKRAGSLRKSHGFTRQPRFGRTPWFFANSPSFVRRSLNGTRWGLYCYDFCTYMYMYLYVTLNGPRKSLSAQTEVVSNYILHFFFTSLVPRYLRSDVIRQSVKIVKGPPNNCKYPEKTILSLLYPYVDQ